jgi:D-serine dehydratase
LERTHEDGKDHRRLAPPKSPNNAARASVPKSGSIDRTDQLTHRCHILETGNDSYLRAVAAGRERAAEDPHTYFVDDESSMLLLEGYAAAAQPLAQQLGQQAGRPRRSSHSSSTCLAELGGAPGGIALGLAGLFGPDVHCFFAEPVPTCCGAPAARSFRTMTMSASVLRLNKC